MDVPPNANNGCVGPKSDQAGKAANCAGCPNQKTCASGAGRTEDPAVGVVNDKLANVKHKIIVLSGKGGVGKSTVACQLASNLALQGNQVGLLDVDICGPSVPRMLGLSQQEVHQSGSGWTPIQSALPAETDGELQVMSVGFMLPNKDDAIIWRGPRKNGLIKQFLTDVDWGTLDYLIIDTPPGTSDEHLSIIQYLRGAGIDGAIIVTTPQEIAMQDVRKEINFCKKTGVRVLGVVENMSGFQAPFSPDNFQIFDSSGNDVTASMMSQIQAKCPELFSHSVRANILPAFGAGPEGMANDFGVPFLGSIPMEQQITQACESGSFLPQHSIPALDNVISAIVQSVETNQGPSE